jgi:hypothetical protein
VSEERGLGEGAGAHATLLSDTLWAIGLAESATWERVRKRKTPMNLCACMSEERGHGEGAGANATLQKLLSRTPGVNRVKDNRRVADFTCELGECSGPGFGLMFCDATGHSYNYFRTMPPP